MYKYRKGQLVATDRLPMMNNVHYRDIGIAPIVYEIYSYTTLVGWYDLNSNTIIEWARATHYSKTTSIQMTKLCNRMNNIYGTRRYSISKDGAIKFAQERNYY